MNKRFLLVSVVALGMIVMGMVSAPAEATPPEGKAYFGFWELNPGGMGPVSISDCFEFTNHRMCSFGLGKCWGFTLTGLDGTVQSWDATLSNVGFFGPVFWGVGNLKMTGSGRVELRGLGSASNFTGQITNPVAARSGFTIDMHEDPTCAFLRPGGLQRLSPKHEGILERKLAGGDESPRGN